MTIINGLAANDIDLEAAKKYFAQKFSCGCSKSDTDELIIQGDVVDSLFDVIPEKFSQVNKKILDLILFVKLLSKKLDLYKRTLLFN